MVPVEVEILAPVSEVWKALTNKISLKEWFFEVDDFQLTTGFIFKFKVTRENKIYPVTCRIISFEENKFLSFTWSYDIAPTETIVHFELSGSEQKSLVSLTHKSIEHIQTENSDLGEDAHAAGWQLLIKTALKNYIEKSWAAWQKFE